MFTSKSKSDLGWGFLAVVETGRYKEYGTRINADKNGFNDQLQNTFWRQVEHCQSTVLEGPGKKMRWGVPDGTRDDMTGEMVHDDLLVSAAMCWVLDGLGWGLAESEVIRGFDPVEGMGEVF